MFPRLATDVSGYAIDPVEVGRKFDHIIVEAKPGRRFRLRPAAAVRRAAQRPGSPGSWQAASASPLGCTTPGPDKLLTGCGHRGIRGAAEAGDEESNLALQHWRPRTLRSHAQFCRVLCGSALRSCRACPADCAADVQWDAGGRYV